MLHCVSTADLPRPARQLKLLHHGMGGVAIVAIAYGGGELSPTSSSVAASKLQTIFSLLEIPLPHTGSVEANTPRLIHMRSPRPDLAVESVTPFRSTDGDTVYLLVQCRGGSDEATTVETHLYRREAAVPAEQGEENASGPAHYQRLPRPVDTDGRVWTATAAVLSTESAIAVQPGQQLPRPLVVAASGSGDTAHLNALQWVELKGPTRAEVVRTVELPALSRFAVTTVVPVPGTGGRRVLLLCHHAVVEVEAVVGAEAAATTVSNAAITRTWKWTPHDRLTACCLKDYTLCAGTEEGVLVLWDLRKEQAVDAAASPPASCTAAQAAITGLCAPLSSSGFVTCALDGTLLSWQHVEDDDAAAVLASQQQQQQQRRQIAPAADTGKRVLSSGGALGTAAAAALVLEREMQRRPGFPYVAAPPGAEISSAAPAPKKTVLPGTPGCVAMMGEGSLLAVSREFGQLEVYLCD